MTIQKMSLALLVVALAACSENGPQTGQGKAPSNNGPIKDRMMMPPMMPAVGVAVAPVVPAIAASAVPGGDLAMLPVLVDADGNPDDMSATYNLRVENNVPVTVDTPNGSWITPMMRYNGLQLQPVIKAKRGMNITVNVTNNLNEINTVHWHGFKIPGTQDGGPDIPIAAGGSRTYSFKMSQAAASLWFHPHAHGFTASQVYKGLAGAFILTDSMSDQLETSKQIPSGAYDVPLLVQDRKFKPAVAGVRALDYTPNMMMGMLGDTVLVNGAQFPSLKVETRQYRFRIFNGSNARTYNFALSNGAAFKVLGTDGGLLPAPVSTDRVVLASGERAEIVVDFSTFAVNDNVALVNRSVALTSPLYNIVNFNVATQAADDVVLYANLPTDADINQRLTAADAKLTRNFTLGMTMAGGMKFTINGKLFNMNRVDERVPSGTTEIWNITNNMMGMMPHPFHAHAIQWQVLSRGGVPASGIDLGWKDTVLVQVGETVSIIGRFDPVINRGLYVYHCHILEHEDAGMMGTFLVQ